MTVTFKCYNDDSTNSIIYICDEMPEVFGSNEGLGHHWTDFTSLCKHVAKKECGLRGSLRSHARSEDADGVEVHTITISEVKE